MNQQNVYKSFGQFDNTVSITLQANSEDSKKYGNSITGEIFYKDSERSRFQEQLDNNEQVEEFGKVKVRDLISGFDKKTKYDLLYDGINIENITEILSIPFSSTNNYSEKSLRKLPKPIVVKFDSRRFNVPKGFIWLNDIRRKDGFGLTEFEELEDVGYRIILNDYTTPEGYEKFANDDYVRYFVLEYKFVHAELTEEEDQEFRALIEKKSSENIAILFSEMKKGANNDLSFLKGKIDIVNKLTVLVALFKPERLTSTKVPVWWNLERFLHIFLRHVSNFQYGEINEEKTAFQYNLNDIKRLVEIILDNLSEEINFHFAQYPERDFKRQGGMSYYYNGDFYVVHISKDGLLLTLYKNN